MAEHIPAPTYQDTGQLQTLVTNLDASPHLGRLAICRVVEGEIVQGQTVAHQPLHRPARLGPVADWTSSGDSKRSHIPNSPIAEFRETRPIMASNDRASSASGDLLPAAGMANRLSGAIQIQLRYAGPLARIGKERLNTIPNFIGNRDADGRALKF